MKRALLFPLFLVLASLPSLPAQTATATKTDTTAGYEMWAAQELNTFLPKVLATP